MNEILLEILKELIKEVIKEEISVETLERIQQQLLGHPPEINKSHELIKLSQQISDTDMLESIRRLIKFLQE